MRRTAGTSPASHGERPRAGDERGRDHQRRQRGELGREGEAGDERHDVQRGPPLAPRSRLPVQQEHVVEERDEEDGDDVDDAGARLDEGEPVERHEQRRRGGEPAVATQPQRRAGR